MRRTMQASRMGVSSTSKLKLGLLAAAVCTTALFVDAGVASASATDCTTGSSDGNTETCVAVVGSGLFVTEITGTACVVDSTRTLQVCVRGPDSALPVCTPFEVVTPGSCIAKPVLFDRNVNAAGEYCTRTWRQNDDGSSPTLIGEQCEDVH
jgi:hypothetical protein